MFSKHCWKKKKERNGLRSEVTRVEKIVGCLLNNFFSTHSPKLALHNLSLGKRNDDFLEAILKCVLSTRRPVKRRRVSTADLGKF